MFLLVKLPEVMEGLKLFPIRVCPFGFSEDTEKKNLSNSQITDQSTTDLFSSEQMQLMHLCW